MPQSYGGMANTLHQLCLGLRSLNHDVSVLSGFRKATDFLSLRCRLDMATRKRLSGVNASRDTHLSYPVWRSWKPADTLEAVVGLEKPDIIVVMGGAVVPVVRSARRLELPIIIQVHDIEEEWHKGDFREVIDLPLVANSRFTAKTYQERYGANAQVIYPYMTLGQYKVNSSRRRVVFINPIFRKGLRTGHEVARMCPHIPFTFVGDLPRFDEDGTPVDPSIFALPNVSYRPFCSDMRDIYKDCRILFVPSQWDEAYGRVVNEAQVSGIPVLASTRGGIPEAVGGGGILLDANAKPEMWAAALDRIHGDEAVYCELSKAALASVSRPELDPDRQVKAHENTMIHAIASVDMRPVSRLEGPV